MATTRQIALAAMEGNQVEDVIDTPININPEPIKVAEQVYIVFRLVNKKVRRLTLDGIAHDVKNPKTGEFETMRLIRGAKSVWTTEMTEFLKDKEYVNRNRIGMQFLDGICRIGVHEKNRLDFARNNPHNVGKNRNGAGKFDFYEYDAAEEQKMRDDVRVQRILLLQTIGSMEETKMVKLALFLGVKPYDDEVGLPRTPDGYRTELSIRADKDPETVKKYMGKPEVDIAYLIRKGILDAKIDLGGQSGTVIWAGNAGYIGKIPKERKPIEYLTELAMTNSKEGKQFKEQLEAIVT